MTAPERLTEAALALRWGLSRRSLQRWRRLRRGPAYLRLGGRITYLQEDVLAFERQCRIEPATQDVAAELDQ